LHITFKLKVTVALPSQTNRNVFSASLSAGRTEDCARS